MVDKYEFKLRRSDSEHLIPFIHGDGIHNDNANEYITLTMDFIPASDGYNKCFHIYESLNSNKDIHLDDLFFWMISDPDDDTFIDVIVNGQVYESCKIDKYQYAIQFFRGKLCRLLYIISDICQTNTTKESSEE